MRIVFMGSPEFSVPTLESLIAAGHDVVAVYTQPDRPAGRGKKDRPVPVAARAKALGLPLYQPRSLRDDAVKAAFAAHDADVAVVVAYGLLLPQAVLEAPRYGCVNIHASLLPRWRGAAPIHRAVMAGDTQTGVCIMQMDAGLDTGPVHAHAVLPIGPEDTTGTLHDRLAAIGAGLIVETLPDLPGSPLRQPDSGATYADKIHKSEAAIDWYRSATEVDRQIRGLSPFPGAYTFAGSERLKLLGSRLVDGAGRPGEVLDGFTVACGEGAVEITKAQRAGKGAQDSASFLLGFPLAPGTILGPETQTG